MNQRESQNGIGVHGAQDSDNRVASMLSALPRVNAPENFEFGVKAKIAARKDVQGGVRIVPFLKVAAPLCLLLVFGAFFLFYGPTGDTNVPEVVQNPSVPAAPIARTASEQPVPEQSVPPAPLVSVLGPRADDELAQAQTTAARAVEPVRKTQTSRRSVNISADVRTSGGSIDRTLGSANTISPPGLGGGTIPVADVFGIIGVQADFVGGTWKVSSSKENSMAQRAGIAAGDVIEAIDGRPLAEKTTFKGSITPTSVRVKRDGKQVELKLGN